MSTPYKMKGSENLGYGNQHSSSRGVPYASPAKDRETWSVEAHRDEAAAHNALSATADHFGSPHGSKPETTKTKTAKKKDDNLPKGHRRITDAEGKLV